jgi:hypothetical protein
MKNAKTNRWVKIHGGNVSIFKTTLFGKDRYMAGFWTSSSDYFIFSTRISKKQWPLGSVARIEVFEEHESPWLLIQMKPEWVIPPRRRGLIQRLIILFAGDQFKYTDIVVNYPIRNPEALPEFVRLVRARGYPIYDRRSIQS